MSGKVAFHEGKSNERRVTLSDKKRLGLGSRYFSPPPQILEGVGQDDIN